jgi:hypothetical protein
VKPSAKRSYPVLFTDSQITFSESSLQIYFKPNPKNMKELSLEVFNPHCAGIDIGSRFHLVAIGQKEEDVKRFGIYTEDHRQLIQWLEENKVTSIAMESTGSYWQTLFDALQHAGFEVILVNGNQVKNVKGKKTDVSCGDAYVASGIITAS